MATIYTYGTIRKYIIGMLNQFSNIRIQRIVDEQLYESLVPVQWGSMERAFLHQDDAYQENQKSIQSRIPRMALTLDGIEYDEMRKGPRGIPEYIHITEDISTNQYPPVPYKFNFTLSIVTKTIDDYFQIIEQIVPYYNPTRNINIKEVPMQTDTTSIKVMLDAISFEPEIDYDSDGNQRLVNGSLSFSLSGNMYMPIQNEDPNVIHSIFIKYFTEVKEEISHFDEYVHQVTDTNLDGEITPDDEIDSGYI